MKNGLPVSVVVSSALARGSRYAGPAPLSHFPRLRESLAEADPAHEIQVDVRLHQVDTGAGRGSGWLSGNLRGHLPLVCQRCLRRFDWPLDAAVALRLVHSEAEEARLMQTEEPLLIEDDRLRLREVVEDELLLALPLAPVCDDLACADPQTRATLG